MAKTSMCELCGGHVVYSGVGRPSRFCSDECRAANKVANDRARYERKREQILAQKREYHVLNRETIREKDAAYHAMNRDRRNEQARAWRARNLDEVRAHDRERYASRREASLESMRNRRLRLQARTPEQAASDARQAHPDGSKKCRSGHIAALDVFYADRSRTDGLSLYCAEHYYSRRRVVVRGDWDCSRCFYCGSEVSDFHVDHVVPVALGGADDLRNFAPACAPCNLSKNDSPVAEWYSRKFGRAFEPDRHPHASWLAAQYPGLYPTP